MRRFWFEVEFPLLSTTISWLTGNAAVVSGLSAVTYWLAVSGIDSPVAPEPPSQIADMETWISAGLSISGSGRVGFLFPVGFLHPEYRRNYGFPCVWPEDHGSVGSTRLTSLECVTAGVRSVSRAARWEADSHGRVLRPTLLDDVVSVVSAKIRYLLDWELTQATDKIHDSTVTQILLEKTGQKWELLLPLT